ncbi:hypothetical protein [Priestia megaterium]|uniref:Uncharacterized protein n=1 Tax=Priestia megaterium TaxID=1404 RepID=A0A6M6E5X6_PRIMG|nr:hypothetical protein [Priestia megaterium]QJX80529.1 hypothetical protein FDZ14_31050 [Priestia megaterium]
MQWDEVRNLYPNQWVLLDIYAKVERDGVIIPLDMKVVNVIPNDGLIVRKARGSLSYLPYHTKHKHISIRNIVK